MKKYKTGIVFGCFDLLHTGHNLLLAAAKELCEYVIVGLQTDPTIDRPNIKNKPVQTLFERWINLNSSKYVNNIIPYQTETELEDILRSFKVDVRFLGGDYIGEDFTGKDICDNLGIKIEYISRHHDYSTSSLRQRVYHAQKDLLDGLRK